MTPVTEIVPQILEEAKLQIQQNMADKGINASGQTSASLHVVTTAEGCKLVSDNSGAPFVTTEEGAPPHEVPTNFVDIILRWSKNKGLNFDRKTAGAVAHKIATKGYGRGKIGDAYGTTRSDIYTDVLVGVADKIKKSIFASVQETIKMH